MSEINDTLQVYCRLKPMLESYNSCVSVENSTAVILSNPENELKKKKHTFTEVFDTFITQEEIFYNVAQPLVYDLLEGKSSLFFTFGVTGSGKTYTMRGDREKPGIIPRVIKNLFQHVSTLSPQRIKGDGRNGYLYQADSYDYMFNRGNARETYVRSVNRKSCDILDDIEILPMDDVKIGECSVFISMMELYNDKFYDLLNEKSTKETLDIKDDMHKKPYVQNLKEIDVQTAQEALTLFYAGEQRRKVAETSLNSSSSRSHLIFTIKLVKLINKNKFEISQINLCDLAGSERANRTGATSAQLKEAGGINNSLGALKNCLNSLKLNMKFFPYRSNKLTHLFQPLIESASRIRMVVCVQGLAEEFKETLFVLNFAESTTDIVLQKPTGPRILTVTRPAKLSLDSTGTSSTVTSSEDLDPLQLEIAKLEEEARLFTESTNVIESGFAMVSNVKSGLLLLSKITELIDKTESESDKLLQDILVESSASERKKDDDRKKITELESKLNDITYNLQVKDTHIGQENSKLAQQRLELSQKNSLIRSLEAQLKLEREQIEKLKSIDAREIKKVKTRTSGVVIDPQNNVSTLRNKFDTKSKVTTTAGKNTPRGAYNARYNTTKNTGTWLEHKENIQVPDGTLLSKKIYNLRKSTSKPDLRDLKASDNYLLQHQMVDSQSNLQTDYYKGQIIPTAGGGRNVTLYEVEKQKQTQIRAAKRPSTTIRFIDECTSDNNSSEEEASQSRFNKKMRQ